MPDTPRSEPDVTPIEDPLALLERSFIEEFLLSRGYTPEVLRAMPPRAVQQVLAEAAEAASLLLAQIESRAHYVNEMQKREQE